MSKNDRPRSYMLRMAVILLVTFIIIGLLFGQLAQAFAGNFALNSVIVATALIGVAFIFRQTWRLVPEAKWLSEIQKTNTISRSAPRPVLLATVHVMLSDASEEGQLSAYLCVRYWTGLLRVWMRHAKSLVILLACWSFWGFWVPSGAC